MKKIIIDTNALISFITDRNAEQQQKISRLFTDAAKLRLSIFCHHHVLSEFVYVLSSVYNVPSKDIHRLISDFITMPGVQIVTDINISTVLSYWPAKITDYGDAIIAAQGLHTKGTAVATFDKKFISTLKRIGLQIFEMDTKTK